MKWKTKDNGELEIKDMDTSHIKSCIKLLEHKGYISARTLAIYLSAPTDDMGDMALDCFNREFDDICKRPVSAYLTEFEKELETRGL